MIPTTYIQYRFRNTWHFFVAYVLPKSNKEWEIYIFWIGTIINDSNTESAGKFPQAVKILTFRHVSICLETYHHFKNSEGISII